MPPPTPETSHGSAKTEAETGARAPNAMSVSYQSIVFAIIIFATLYVARGFLLPVFASLLLSYALIPAVRLLTKIRIPRVLASFIVVTVFFAAVTYGIVSLSAPAMSWLEKAPHSFDKLEQLANAIKRPVENVNAATEQLNQMTSGSNEKRKVVVQLEEASIVQIILSQTPIVIGATISTLILLFFLLAFGNVLLKRIVEISPRLKDKRRAVETAREIEHTVSSYLVTVTTINIALGVCVGVTLFALGFENPILWGAMATVLNFIPYLGAFAGVFLLTFASLSVTENIELALVYPAAYLVLTLLEGNIITPMILGRSFMINPIFIILVLLFLGWLWGIPGAVMAVPLLVAVKSAASRFDGTRSLSTLLSK